MENHFKILKARIKQELDILTILVENCEEFYMKNKNELDNSINLRVLGSFLHDFYTVIEKIFRVIAQNIDGELPNGPSWYSDLLERMNLEIPSVRRKVIDDEVSLILYDYLRFRHNFRNVYGFELNWDKMEHLVVSIKENFGKFNREIKEFVNFLDNIF